MLILYWIRGYKIGDGAMLRKILKRFDLNTITKEDYKNNAIRLWEANEKMFFSSLFILSIVFAVLFIASFFASTISANRMVYLIALGFIAFLALLENVILPGYSIWMSYILAIGIFLVGMEFNVSYDAHMATILLPVFVLLPIIVIDESWKVNTMMGIMWLISIVSSFLLKSTYIAGFDLIHYTVFTIIGIYLGEVLKGTRIKHFKGLYTLSMQKYVDQLTGMYNRRKLFDDLTEDSKNAKFVGIIMIDIDWFKKLNDTKGHEKGDECLKAIGKCFTEFGSKNDLTFYRYGGEEFIGISKTHSNQKLREISNNLLRAVRELNIPAEYSCYERVTVSIGFTEGLIKNEKEYEELIDKADKALYRAKSVSRNTCIGYVADKFV